MPTNQKTLLVEFFQAGLALKLSSSSTWAKPTSFCYMLLACMQAYRKTQHRYIVTQWGS